MDTDSIYEQWRNSSEDPELLNQLIKEMTSHARAICLKKIPRLKQEHDFIINGAVADAVLGLGGFDNRSKFSTWFYVVVNNAILLFVRDQKSESAEEELDENLVEEVDPDKQLIAKEILAKIQDLTPEEELLLELRAAEVSHADIALELGISEDAAKMRWSRLRERLQEQLND